jgi:hypothetical protein
MVNKVKIFFMSIAIHLFEALEAMVDISLEPAPKGLVMGIALFVIFIVGGDIGENRKQIHTNTNHIGTLIDLDFQLLDLIVDTRNEILVPLDTLGEVNSNRRH